MTSSSSSSSIALTPLPWMASTTTKLTLHAAQVTWTVKRSSWWLSIRTSQALRLRPQTGQL